MNYMDALESLHFISGGMEEKYQDTFNKTIKIIKDINQEPEASNTNSLLEKLDTLRNELSSIDPPPNTRVIYKRNSDGIYEAVEEIDVSDDPNIILHSKYAKNHTKDDRLDYRSATKNLLQDYDSSGWSDKKLTVECRALIIDIAKACNDEMLWYEDIMVDNTNDTTIKQAISSLKELVDKMESRGVRVDGSLKKSIDRLNNPEGKHISEKIQKSINSVKKNHLKMSLKLHIKNELKKDIEKLYSKQPLKSTEAAYLRELQGALEVRSQKVLVNESARHSQTLVTGNIVS